MKRRLTYLCARALVVAAMLTLLLAVHGGAAPASAVVNCTIETSMDSEERAFLTLLNNHRAQNGLQPLGVSYKLSRAAQWKSNDLGVNAYFAHDDLNRTWVQRIRDCGYGYNAWLGENIAAGNSGALATFNQWKNSSGHNANMLGSNYTTVGIGRAYVAGSPYGWYWTTEFGSVDDGWAAATSPPAPNDLPTATPSPLTIKLKQRANGDLHINATAPRSADVARVDFYLDGALVRSDRRAPYTATARGNPSSEIRIVAYGRNRRVMGVQVITGAVSASR